MSTIATVLYLHGGPGLNCAVERAWFGENYPVLWWDQPRLPADAENAYQTTLDTAAEQLGELHVRQGKPIDVIGWSFGARVALDLAHRAPEAIGVLTLLAPSLCLETAFNRMAGFLSSAKGEGIPVPVLPPLPSDSGVGNHEDFMQRVISILSMPTLLSHYWAPASADLFARHGAAAASANWFDLDTFTAVSQEVIKRPIIPLPGGRLSRIRIFAGLHDPYFDPRTDIDLWETIFPEASIRIEDAGHMLPFEILATEWLKPSLSPSAIASPAP